MKEGVCVCLDRQLVVCVGLGAHSERALCEPCYKALIKHTCWAIPIPSPSSLWPPPLLVCGGDNGHPASHVTAQPPNQPPERARPVAQTPTNRHHSKGH